MATKKSDNSQGGALAEVYARSLFELASEAGTLADAADELKQIVQLLAQQPKLAAVFAHKTIAVKRRAATIRNVFAGRVSDMTLRFLLVLNDHGRLDQLAGIAAAFDRLLKQQRNQVDVDVFTARPLSADQAATVGARITGAIGRTAILHLHTDESLIGGLKIRIEDKLIDASVASRLRRMRRNLVGRGHDLVRTAAGRLLEE